MDGSDPLYLVITRDRTVEMRAIPLYDPCCPGNNSPLIDPTVTWQTSTVRDVTRRAPDGRVLIAGGKRTSWWGHRPCRLARRSERMGGSATGAVSSAAAT